MSTRHCTGRNLRKQDANSSSNEDSGSHLSRERSKKSQKDISNEEVMVTYENVKSRKTKSDLRIRINAKNNKTKQKYESKGQYSPTLYSDREQQNK